MKHQFCMQPAGSQQQISQATGRRGHTCAWDIHDRLLGPLVQFRSGYTCARHHVKILGARDVAKAPVSP